MEDSTGHASQPASQDASDNAAYDALESASRDDLRNATDSGLSIRELEAQITELAGHLNAANNRWLKLIAEFDRRQGWSDGFTHSCAHWLSWKCGLDLGAAREKVRVARALESLPLVATAMSRGELSYSKVRAITRVATPATEEGLLNVALHGTAHHIETLVRQFRRVQEVEEVSREARQYSQRRLSYFFDQDGSMIVKLQLPAESGALLLKALDAALLDVPLPNRDEASVARFSTAPASNGSDDYQAQLHVSAGTSSPSGSGGSACCSADTLPRTTQDFRVSGDSPSWSARRADALVVLAESFLQHGAEVLTGGDRQQIVVHVDECTLRHGAAGRCEHDDGPAMPVETARRLACDCSVVKITEDERGEPLDVGRKTRSIPPALRRALASRDKGCVFPGCNHKRYVDGHHIQHWADGGETKLSNLVTLCRFHHRAVHEGGLRIDRCDDGAWRFSNKHGESMFACAPGHSQPLGDWRQLPVEHAARGIVIDAGTAATRWRGERMDYGIAIDSLLSRTAWEARRTRGDAIDATDWI
jgi:hypothetical protein